MRSPDKLGWVQDSVRLMLQRLSPEDTIAMATYAGSVQRVLPPTPVREAAPILGALEQLHASGGTAMASGVALAYDMASEAYVDGHTNRVIVFSDGDANIGPSTHGEILARISAHAGQGITLSTLGFGEGNYQDHLMEQLADSGDGNYYYIDSLAESERVLVDRLSSTLAVIARDVKLQVAFNHNSVARYRLLGYENRAVADEDFREDDVDGGEVGAGHQVTALYEVALKQRLRRTPPMATMMVRAKPPGPDAPAQEWVHPIYIKSLRSGLEGSSEDTRLAAAASVFAALLRGSPHARGDTYRTPWALLDSIGDHDPAADAERNELRDLVARADIVTRGLWEKSAIPREGRGPAL
jgi:Ca-activated chloride channel family protein